jgi:hypothetical protein
MTYLNPHMTQTYLRQQRHQIAANAERHRITHDRPTRPEPDPRTPTNARTRHLRNLWPDSSHSDNRIPTPVRLPWHRDPASHTYPYVAIRLSGGLGPTLLGVPAEESLDRTANPDELLPGH